MTRNNPNGPALDIAEQAYAEHDTLVEIREYHEINITQLTRHDLHTMHLSTEHGDADQITIHWSTQGPDGTITGHGTTSITANDDTAASDKINTWAKEVPA